MKLREDVEYVSSLVENKLINLSLAKELASLPLMIIPNESLPEQKDFKEYWDNNLETGSFINLFEWSGIPFWDFVVLYNFHDDWKVVRKKAIKGDFISILDEVVYCRITIDIENKFIRKSYSGNGYDWISNESVVDSFDEKSVMDHTKTVYRNINEGRVDLSDPSREDFLNEVFGRCFNGIFGAINAWHEFHCKNDRYVISVKQNKMPKIDNLRTREIAKVLGPRIIYLDKLPSEDEEIVSESGNGTKAPHQRKGHWATLKHERYKNHPQYLVKNGVYRKPMWIGDRTRIVHGATYTVIDKQVNLEE